MKIYNQSIYKTKALKKIVNDFMQSQQLYRLFTTDITKTTYNKWTEQHIMHFEKHQNNLRTTLSYYSSFEPKSKYYHTYMALPEKQFRNDLQLPANNFIVFPVLIYSLKRFMRDVLSTSNMFPLGINNNLDDLKKNLHTITKKEFIPYKESYYES